MVRVDQLATPFDEHPLLVEWLLGKDATTEAIARLDEQVVDIGLLQRVCRAQPCGAATDDTLAEAYRLALETDPLSAFGSIVGLNRVVDIDTALLLHKAGARFGEIPTVFVNRKRGRSNTTLSEITDAFIAVWELRRRYA